MRKTFYVLLFLLLLSMCALNQGDKFKDSSIVIYDITPGETYTLALREYDW